MTRKRRSKRNKRTRKEKQHMASAREIRISITSALNAAGIEATKQQLDALSKHVKKTSAEMKEAGAAGGEWTKLPGVFGKVQNALGGIAGKALGVVGAFKTGVDIGNWIQEKIIVPLFKIKDPIEELKKANRELKREADAAANAWAKSQNTVTAELDAAAKAADAAVAKIDKLAAAYIRMQDARLAVSNAETDAEQLKLQRDKFTDMTQLAQSGNPEQAAQIGKYYDVLIEETKAKKDIAKTDAEIAKTAAEIEAREKSITTLKAKERMAEQRYLEAAKKVERLDNGDELGNVWGDQWDKAMEQAVKNRDKALADWGRLTEKRKAREGDLDVLKVEADARQKERDTAAAAAELEIDKKKQEYDDYVTEIERQNVEVAQQAAEAQRKATEQQIAQEKASRQRMEQELVAEKIKNLQRLTDEEKRRSAAADTVQAAAESKLQQAWGWYRNKDSMAAQMEEEKKEAAAQKQFEKDFEKLKDRKGREWRKAENLTVEEEAVRRVAMAREEKEQADKWAQETAENTRELAAKLDELLQVKG